MKSVTWLLLGGLVLAAVLAVVMAMNFSRGAPVEVARDRKSMDMRIRIMLEEAVFSWGVNIEGVELRHFESVDGKDLWKELALPAPLSQLKLHAGTPLEEAAICQVLAARALLEKLKWDNRDIEPLRAPMEKAEAALSSGDHLEALRLAFQVTESGLGKL